MPQMIPQVVRLKTALKMSVQRLRYAQEKQQALAKQSRREVAQLLSQGKEQKAQYRVETLINDDIHIELLEILELYCELLHARVSILNAITDECDLITHHIEDGINEAVRAIAYAQLHAPEIKDLVHVKELLVHKFGIDFLKAIVEDKAGVPAKVSKKCSPFLADSGLVTLYLKEIASTYGVPFSGLNDSTAEECKDLTETTESIADSELGDRKPILALDNDELGDDEHPITVKKPRKNSETLDKKLAIPKSIAKDVKVSHKKEKVSLVSDELEDLKKRFEALRR
ncbi:Ist1p Ecym_1091 [Eremothecium cymbalariae DBVPG|uniref:Vacuolar protein sorting-associated protein IST1 n=1 Tax=Eremothecium cymbalariae (strain CBS 270.75 / DBVPG 7215 / KCTC 17166 / NRRL Y-17582) TaxID=931890 RepID=G8JMD9_ERECY|nr:hypothetical protein Ecym_1091 [Eremothecium cymbalariae DBVPG\